MVSTPLYPIFSIFPGTVRPGTAGFSPKPGSFSIRNVLMFRCGASWPSSVLHSTATRLAVPPLVSHIFCPLSTNSSPSRTALVRMAATSEPRPGSDMENAPRTSPAAIRGRKQSFCSSVPCLAIMWATMKWVLMMPDTDIQPRAISSTARA